MIKIEINHSKCPTPFDCKKCLQICPQAIFLCHAVKTQKYRETDPKEPGAYLHFPYYVDKCTGCGDCVKVCPNDAIKLILPEK